VQTNITIVVAILCFFWQNIIGRFEGRVSIL